jgi:hypothetical protein
MAVNFQQFIPLLIPILIIQLILVVAALMDLYKQPATRGPKWVWALVIPFIQIIGPVLYFAVGRKEY